MIGSIGIGRWATQTVEAVCPFGGGQSQVHESKRIIGEGAPRRGEAADCEKCRSVWFGIGLLSPFREIIRMGD